jgi:hypothetical protein
MAGISGATGATGAAGQQGAIGATGAQGPLAGYNGWSPFRDFTFYGNSDEILRSDSNKAREVSDYARQNPSYQVGIDGSNVTRVNNVRNALIDAGVPASKIHAGPFGNPQLRRDDLVAVLISNN